MTDQVAKALEAGGKAGFDFRLGLWAALVAKAANR
jgi:hypothetical protein